jgi:hypothetical protein
MTRRVLLFLLFLLFLLVANGRYWPKAALHFAEIDDD